MVTKEQLRESIKYALHKMGCEESAIESFMNNEIELFKLGICNSCSRSFDEILTQEYPDYDGCLIGEKIDEILEYNLMLINNANGTF